MTRSQKIARAFEIVDYILLVPTALIALWSTPLAFSAPVFTLLIYGIFLAGCALMVGYFKHSRGRLDDKQARSLWVWTGVFNGILLLPYLFYTWFFFSSLNSNFSLHQQPESGFIFYLCMIFGYLTAIFLSVAAYQYDKNQKLR